MSKGHPVIHALARNSQPTSGECCWLYPWEDVDLRCGEPVIPGSAVCPDHLIAIQTED